jgi:hypothetical protein
MRAERLLLAFALLNLVILLGEALYSLAGVLLGW